MQRGEAAYLLGHLATADGMEKKNLKRRETGRCARNMKQGLGMAQGGPRAAPKTQSTNCMMFFALKLCY